MKKALFVCIHNSGRSQMAEAFAKRLGEGVIEASSAGTQLADGINPTVLQVMGEIGYDMNGQYPKIMTKEAVRAADIAITMGCDVTSDASCPGSFIPTDDWGLDDPRDKPIESVRKIRDEIRLRVEQLVATESRRQRGEK